MGSFLKELFQGTLYKRTQGRVARKVTFFVIIVVLAYAVYRFAIVSDFPSNENLRYAIGTGIFLLGGWVAFRLVNFPKFADFLIAVEAEMKKVSWPTSSELYKASIVVIAVMLIMATSILAFDLVFKAICGQFGIT